MKKVVLSSFLLLMIMASSAWAGHGYLARGTRSKAVAPAVMVARSPKEVNDIISLFLPGIRNDFQVNFDKNVLFFVFGGKVPTAGYKVEIERASYDDGSIDVDFRMARASGGFFAQVVSSPWVAVTVSK